MAEIVRYVSRAAGVSAGGDGTIGDPYFSLTEWEAAEQTDLTAIENATVSSVSGTFQMGETLSFSSSGATGVCKLQSGTDMSYSITTGTPTTADTITGDSSTATADIDTIDSTGATHVCKFLGADSVDDSALIIEGWTTNATYFITIEPESDTDRARSLWDSGKYTLSDTGAASFGSIQIKENNTVIDGMQILKNTTSEYHAHGIRPEPTGSGNQCIIKNNFLRYTGSGNTSFYGIGVSSSTWDSHVFNNIIVGWKVGILLKPTDDSIGSIFRNTIVDSTVDGIDGNNVGATYFNRPDVYDNLVSNSTTNNYNGVRATTSGGNVSDDANTNFVTGSANETFTFVDAGNSDYTLASGDTGARGNGTDLSSDVPAVTTDINGVTVASPYDSGAAQYEAAPAGGVVGPLLDSAMTDTLINGGLIT